MIITKIELFSTRVPTTKAYVTGDRKMVAEQFYVQVHTDDGLVGLGESEALTKEGANTAMSLLAISEVLGPNLMGRDPLKITELNALMDQELAANNPAKAALDIAFYDLLGKKAGLPVYALLGGARRTDPLSLWPIGCDSPDEAADIARRAKEEGYRMLGIKVGGAGSVQDDIDRVRAVRETVGDEVSFTTDANQAWDEGRAVKFARAVEKYRPSMLEQPLPAGDVAGMARVRARIGIPLSADEGVYSIDTAKQYIEHRAADLFSIKPSKDGGITKAVRLIQFAGHYGVPCFMNTMLEEGVAQAATLHVGLSSGNYLAPMDMVIGHCYSSPMRLVEDVTDYHLQYSRGKIIVNGKPGLGVTFREEILQTYRENYAVLS